MLRSHRKGLEVNSVLEAIRKCVMLALVKRVEMIRKRTRRRDQGEMRPRWQDKEQKSGDNRREGGEEGKRRNHCIHVWGLSKSCVSARWDMKAGVH